MKPSNQISLCLYQINCSCGEFYVGQTQRNLITRLNDHNPAISTSNDTDVTKHLELYPFTKNFFGKTFVRYMTVWLGQIWTYKNADEKGHTFLQ